MPTEAPQPTEPACPPKPDQAQLLEELARVEHELEARAERGRCCRVSPEPPQIDSTTQPAKLTHNPMTRPRFEPPSSATVSQEWLIRRITDIENHVGADVISIYGIIASGMEHKVRVALENLPDDRRDTLLVLLDTSGGVVEIVERIVTVTRHHYDEIKFVIPDRAMSAGTVLAMSGDAILMGYFSCLGPVDPQLEKEGQLVPALSYLEQFDRLVEKSRKGTLTSAELVLLEQLDLAELHQYELARDLSVQLIRDWLVSYKFKDWTVTETRQLPVTPQMKQERAVDIAKKLNDHARWASHGRGISAGTLRSELNLKIDDLDADEPLRALVDEHLWFLRDWVSLAKMPNFVHGRGYI